LRTERRTEIQWLRGLAASEVVICHSDLVTKHFSPFRITELNWYHPLLGIGVEVFFMVSGYVICMRAAKHATGSAFLFSRIRRLFPMYWLFTSLVVLAYIANPAWRLNNFDPGLWSLVQSYLILPQWNFPILGVGWTLEHEMMFYTFVALMMALWSMEGPAKYTLPWSLAIFGIIGCLYGGPAPGKYPGPEQIQSVWAAHIFSPYMLAFGFGWLIRCVEEMTPSARLWNVAIFVALGAAAYPFASEYGSWLLFRLAIAAVIFTGFIACRRLFEADSRLNRFAWRFGDASFSIYLCHWLVLSALGKALGVLDPPVATAELLRFLAIAISVAVGFAIYFIMEKPLDRWLWRGEVLSGGWPRVASAWRQNVSRLF
jgi:peptidoglycan/LPS O-acetylase OafA/YrhL